MYPSPPAPSRRRCPGRSLRDLLSCCGFLFLAAGCDVLTYEPSRTHFVEVAPPATGIEVDFATEGDTLAGWGSIAIRYRLDLQGKAFVSTHVYVDDVLLLETADPSSFTLDSRRLSNGPHALRLEAYARSGTGSLADRLGAEVVFHRRPGVLVVDNAPPAAVAVRSIQPADGRLRVTWEPYRRPNFQAYQVFRAIDPNHATLVGTFTDPARTTWTDSSFVGAEVHYWVQVHAAGQSATGEPIAFRAPVPAIVRAQPVSEDQVRLVWTACRFPANFTHYTLWPSEGEPIVVTAVDDTTLVTTIAAFGAERTYTLSTSSEHGVAYSEPVTAWAGQRVPGIGLPQPLGDGYVARTDSHLVLIAERDKQVVARYPIDAQSIATFITDPAGTRLFASWDGALWEHDPGTLARLRKLDLPSLLGYEGDLVLLAASSDGLLSLMPGRRDGNTMFYQGPVLLDFDSGRLVARYDDLSGREILDLHPSGRYVVVRENGTGRTTLHRVDGGRLHEAATLYEGGSAPYAALLLAETLVESRPGTLSVRRLTDQALLNTFAVSPDLMGPVYDHATGTLGGWSASAGRFEVYDPARGERVASVAAAPAGYPFALIGGTLWSKHGFYRSLDLP